MENPKAAYYAKRGQVLVKNLKARHFDAWYCETKEQALQKALELIPRSATIAWGGAMTCKQIGLQKALRDQGYLTLDQVVCTTPEEEEELKRRKLFCDVFLTGANALSLTGEMVNIDGTGNRVAAIVYGPKEVLVVAGMNKVVDTLDEAVRRARTVAAPMNKQRFEVQNTPCAMTGVCGDCKTEGCICNQILITRHCRPVGRIKFILVGEDLGL